MSVHFFESEVSLVKGMIILPVRSTVIKTSKGTVVISPIRFTENQFKEIEGFGPVADLVAPSLLHHLSLPRTIERFPTANVWGPPGSLQKLPKIKWSRFFEKDQWLINDEIQYQLIEGAPGMNEIAFLHKASKTLILTDFVFNLTDAKGWGAPIMLRLLGTYNKFAVSKFVNKYIVDKMAVKNSFTKVLQWDFDKVAMGHGDVVTSNAKDQLAKALAARGIC